MPMDFWKTKDVPLEELMPLISEQLEKGNAVRLTPQGTSMLPLLRPGQDSFCAVRQKNSANLTSSCISGIAVNSSCIVW